MALSDLTVFSQWLRVSTIETLQFNYNLFNERSRNALLLGTNAFPGDFFDQLSFKLMSNFVRDRNPYGTGNLTTKVMQNIQDTIVKLAKGTYPIDFSPAQWNWIQQDPVAAARSMSEDMSEFVMADMLDMALSALIGAITNVGSTGAGALVYDPGTATFATPHKLAFQDLITGAGLFGDQSQRIVAWVIHSTPMTSMFLAAFNNLTRLFTYGSVQVLQDPFGRIFIVTDCPALLIQPGNGTTTLPIYATIGLTAGAASIQQQGDMTENFDTRNGTENISRTYQAEWSYGLGIKGFAWDKTNGGKAPNAAAVAVGTNWDKYVTDKKNTAGVIVLSNG